jgi:hypothetical protein
MANYSLPPFFGKRMQKTNHNYDGVILVEEGA